MIVVVGAGAAGLAAGLRLREADADFLILEAQDRIGGRAHTIQRDGFALDLGCEWLHHAEAKRLAQPLRGHGPQDRPPRGRLEPPGRHPHLSRRRSGRPP